MAGDAAPAPEVANTRGQNRSRFCWILLCGLFLGIGILVLITSWNARGVTGPRFGWEHAGDLELRHALEIALNFTNGSLGSRRGRAYARRAHRALERWQLHRLAAVPGSSLWVQTGVRIDHRDLLSWLRAERPDLETLAAQVKWRAAYGLGLLLHHQQWVAELSPALLSRPVHRCIGHVGCPKKLSRSVWPDFEAAVDGLEQVMPKLVEEFNQASTAFGEEGDEEDQQGLHLSGRWSHFRVATWKDDARRCERKLFPATCAALREFELAMRRSQPSRPDPYIDAARYATLHPGTRLVQHTYRANDRVKVHCGVHNSGKVQLVIANQSLTWQQGLCFVIDDSYEHHVVSTPAQTARTILELKVTHPDLAWTTRAPDKIALLEACGQDAASDGPVCGTAQERQLFPLSVDDDDKSDGDIGSDGAECSANVPCAG